MALKFKLTISSVPIELEENGTVQKYELREMVASARDQYLDTIADRVRVDSNGKVCGIKKFDGMQADLVSRCMFYGEGNNQGKPVGRGAIQAWPATVVSSLFVEAQKLNRLNEEDKKVEEDSKND